MDQLTQKLEFLRKLGMLTENEVEAVSTCVALMYFNVIHDDGMTRRDIRRVLRPLSVAIHNLLIDNQDSELTN